jgi:hypothetical protein
VFPSGKPDRVVEHHGVAESVDGQEAAASGHRAGRIIGNFDDIARKLV